MLPLWILSQPELTQPRGGGGGSGRALPRCRHIGCVVSHGAAAVSCCVRVIGTCVTCVGYAGRATMTRRGGGGGGRGDHRKVCRGTCRDMGKLGMRREALYGHCGTAWRILSHQLRDLVNHTCERVSLGTFPLAVSWMNVGLEARSAEALGCGSPLSTLRVSSKSTEGMVSARKHNMHSRHKECVR